MSFSLFFSKHFDWSLFTSPFQLNFDLALAKTPFYCHQVKTDFYAIATNAAIPKIVEIATKILAVVLIRTFVLVAVVKPRNSKVQANCALYDTSIKFSTLIAVTNSNILRWKASVMLGVHWFPWKPQFIKIDEIPPFILVYQRLSTFISVAPTCLRVCYV